MHRTLARRCRDHALPGFILAVVLLALTAVTWRRWGDPVIDTGRAFYVAWRLNAGDVLYRDLAYPFGPLSAWVSAALMAVGGSAALVLANLAIIAGLLAMVYAAAARWAGRMVGVVLGTVFLLVFAFSHLQGVGNYNFVLPYAQPLTHGLVLCVVVGWGLDRGLRGHHAAMVVAHAAAGLAALTKPEFVVCAAAQLAVFWWLTLRAGRGTRWWGLVAAGAAVGAAMVPVMLLQPSGFRAAAFAPLWPWGEVRGPAGRTFYGQVCGWSAPWRNVLQVTVVGLAQAVIVAGTVCVARCIARTPRWRGWSIGLALLAIGGFLMVWPLRTLWLHVPRALPLWLGAAWWMALWHVRGGGDAASGPARRLLLVTGAVALLAKIALRTQIDHYGVVLALPASLWVAAELLHGLPVRIGGVAGQWARGAFGGAVAVGVIWHVNLSWHHVRERTAVFGRGAEYLLIDPDRPAQRAAVLQRVIDDVAARSAPGATLAVLPEGCTLNYLLRRRNSTPFFAATPFDLELFGSAAVADALRRAPPDVVVVLARDSTEMGSRFFGFDYGQPILQWLDAAGPPVFTTGTWPPQPGHYGAAVYAPRSARPSGGVDSASASNPRYFPTTASNVPRVIGANR